MFEGIKEKRVLVTGSSSGIGAAIAELFGKYGARVGVHYKENKEGAKKVVDAIGGAGGTAIIAQGDFTKKGVGEKLLDYFIKNFGGIDILVNNAGSCEDYEHFSKIKPEAWAEMLALNVLAPFDLSSKAFLLMKKQKWGRIINISTNSIKYAGANNMHYYSSKAALEAMARGFAREGAKDNVLVNTVRCGLIDTPMRTKIPHYSKKKFAKREAMVPIGRSGKPIEVAKMVLFLASSGGDFITGEVLNVTGGE